MKTRLLKKVRKQYQILYFEKAPHRPSMELQKALDHDYYLDANKPFYVIVDQSKGKGYKMSFKTTLNGAKTTIAYRVRNKYTKYFRHKSYTNNKVWYLS